MRLSFLRWLIKVIAPDYHLRRTGKGYKWTSPVHTDLLGKVPRIPRENKGV